MQLFSELKIEFLRIAGGNELIYTIKWSEDNIYFAKALAERIRNNLVDLLEVQGWSPTTVKRFLDEISINALPNAVIIKSKNKIFNILELGRQESKPRKAVGKVVPLMVNGNLIFRRVTYKSLLMGKWRVPARAGRKIMETSVKQAIADSIYESELESPIIFQKLRQLIQQRLSL